MRTLLNTTSTAAATLLLSVFSLPAQTAAVKPVRPVLPFAPPVVSTVPANGDVNPYGVAFVPGNVLTDGMLQSGDVLVSNFNNSKNLQGTGSTIVRISQGTPSLFFQGKSGLGLTAALGVLRNGIVLVGNTPTTDGTSATVQPGSILVIDRQGRVLGQLTDADLINGPWGMAIFDQGNVANVFVSNVLNGTVVRFDVGISDDGDSLDVRRAVQIGTGFSHRTDPAALVLGPSGLSYDVAHDTLYVADSADNTIYSIPFAVIRGGSDGTGTPVYQDNVHLHGPLDIVQAPNGHLIVANSDGSNADENQPSELVEFTREGNFVAQFPVDPNNGGAFGLALANLGQAFRVAAVDDNANSITIWTQSM